MEALTVKQEVVKIKEVHEMTDAELAAPLRAEHLKAAISRMEKAKEAVRYAETGLKQAEAALLEAQRIYKLAADFGRK